MKKKETKPDAVQIEKVVSVMGRSKFNDEVKKQVMSGTPMNEAPDLIARMKLKGMI